MAIKAKAKLKDGVVDIKILMKHIMETGQRVDSKTGEKIPAHHVTEFNCDWNGANVFKSNLGPAVSKNPYLAFKLKGPASGDTLTMSWVDNKGETDEGSVTIK